jgi:hypothetical protein
MAPEVSTKGGFTYRSVFLSSAMAVASGSFFSQMFIIGHKWGGE